MTQEVFGLRYEFVYRHGHYMELSREEGLASEELSTLQLRMLEANDVPKLLPLQVQEVDFRISLLYNLSAKRMLAHVLKVEGLSKQQFAKLLYTIVCALEESKNYMLHETGYILKDNFIFIGSDWSDVYLTYVPLEPNNEDGSVFDSLEALMNQLSRTLKDEEMDVVTSWLISLSQNRSLHGYKEKLLVLMDETTVVTKDVFKSTTEKEKDAIQHTINQALTENGNGLPKPLWNRSENHRSILNPSIEGIPLSPNELNVDEELHPVSFIPLAQRSQMIVLVVIILLAAFLWQNYFTNPTTGTLQITSGATILFLDAWFVIKFLGIPRYKLRNSGFNLPYTPDVQIQVEHKIEPPPVEPMNIQKYYQNLHMHTTLLSSHKPNATVFLGKVMNQPLGARIEVLIEGAAKTLPLDSDNFTMGRGDADLKVDYVLEEAGVSRIHAEIVKGEEGYEIKDMGSTNGTFLNGVQLVTYQFYPLKDGDEIRIVRHEMKFRI